MNVNIPSYNIQQALWPSIVAQTSDTSRLRFDNEGAHLAAHNSNDSACSSTTTFPSLAPSSARDWYSSLKLDDSAEPALVDSCW